MLLRRTDGDEPSKSRGAQLPNPETIRELNKKSMAVMVEILDNGSTRLTEPEIDAAKALIDGRG